MDDAAFTLLKLEYKALRREICQSIDKQHQILLAGYGAIAAIFGYAYTRTQATPLIALSIPCVCLAMSALWNVECNRMVRASYYLGYLLWDEMRAAAKYAGLAGWESWIRATRKNAHAAVFGRIQDQSQQLVVLWIPIFISLLSIALTSESQFDSMGTRFSNLFGLYLLGVLAGWVWVGGNITKVSNLAAVRPKTDEHYPDSEFQSPLIVIVEAHCVALKRDV